MGRPAIVMHSLPFTLRSRLTPVAVMAGLVVISACGADAAELPLTRVVLSNAGLAQFTHSGPVSGNSSVQLPVRLDQVDDLLKSLTVFDKEGAVGAVSLPGRTPLAELFRDLPFDNDALNSSADLLNALVGSEIEIDGQVSAKGRVFRVVSEEVTLPNNGGTVTRHRLTLMTPTGLVQAILEEITALRFTDPQTRAQIERVLAGLAENRAKDRRTLSVGFLGSGTRNVAISYVVGAPVWKTAYRLVLPKPGGKEGSKARLQGWAVVENLTGGDWKEVDLVLTSGNPVALRQPLYTAIFANRPEVPVSTGTRLVPRVDDVQEKPAAPARREGTIARALAPTPYSRSVAAEPAPGAVAAAASANAAAAEEAATQLLYRFPAKLSLATGHSMMVPFIDREVAVDRIWLYQPDIAANRPLAAGRLRNDGDSLPAGLVTAFDISGDGSTNFVGDALLPLLPKGGSRFVTFALDTKTAIRREDKGIIRTTLGKAVNGTLTTQTRSRRTIAYEVTTPPDEDREIIAEEARSVGWTPASESKGVEETPTRFRYQIRAPKGTTTKASFVTERLDSETVVLTDLGVEGMLARIRQLQNESPRLKDTVAKLGAIMQQINKARAERRQLENERNKIVQDQSRVRDNLQSVGQGSDLGRRYLETLKTQEDRLAEIGRTDAALESDIAAKVKSAEDIARQLTL